MTTDIVTRIEATHPLQYGWRGDEIIYHTEHVTGDHIRERMNRCHICEQWSPCDARKAADEIEQLRNEVELLRGRSIGRREALDEMVDVAQQAGMYEATATPKRTRA
jgi:phosphoribosyl-dephospho-CoA transferase